MFKYNQSFNDNEDFLNEKRNFMTHAARFEKLFVGAYRLVEPFDMTKLHLTDRWFPSNTIWSMVYDSKFWVHIEFTPDVLYIGDFEHREDCDGHYCSEWNCGVLGDEIFMSEHAEKLVSVGLPPDATRAEIYAEMIKAEKDLAEAVLEYEAPNCQTTCNTLNGFHYGACKQFKRSPLAAKFSYYNEPKIEKVEAEIAKDYTYFS